MFKLYFGNIPNALSTVLFLLFVGYFIKVHKKPDGNKKWKKAAIITVLAGTLMSALSGIKDSFADKMAVSFEQMNIPLAVLCGLGGMAVLLGIVAGFCKKEKVNRAIFYVLSIIIIAKTAVVEALRIMDYFKG